MIQRQRQCCLGVIGLTLAALIIISATKRRTVFSAAAAPRRVALAITNPSDLAREDELVVLSAAEVKRYAPGFDAATFVVSEGAAERQLPSQADDLDGDGKADEICFIVSLAPQQTRRVALVYGAGAPPRADYPKRTQAKFSRKYEGLAWESDVIGYRLYFDERNAIDVYGKHDRRLSLGKFAEDGYNYHGDSEWGRDVMKVGQSLGAGSFGLWKDGRLSKVAQVAERNWRLIADGPVRSIIELRAGGWNAGGVLFDLTARFNAVAGQRWAKVEVALRGRTNGFALAAGVMKHAQVETLRDERQGWLATWGQQVENAPGNLGLAVVVPPQRLAQFTEDPLNHLALLSLKDSGRLNYYIAAAWDAEQNPIASAAQWKAYLSQTAARLWQPVSVRFTGRAQESSGSTLE
ncbi:MAG: DUF4861 domain-containing protein [Blastocatellia bacterium]